MYLSLEDGGLLVVVKWKLKVSLRFFLKKNWVMQISD